ncbi:MAG: primosomal protein N' [Bacteroidia bacterium]|nr:primosomal protein N' [Bacteroidia bacterium]
MLKLVLSSPFLHTPILKTFFADIILPLAIPKRYTYRVPQEMNDIIRVGHRVIVQFAASRLYTGIVGAVHEKPPQNYEAKYILELPDENTCVNEKQLELWKWLSDYYMCSEGEVMNAALPSGLKLSSETVIALHPEFSGDISDLTDVEVKIVEALENNTTLKIEDLLVITERKTIDKIIGGLVQKKVLVRQEELKEKFKPKLEDFVELAEPAIAIGVDEEKLEQLFDSLKRAQKQSELLVAYLNFSGRYQNENNPVKKSALLKAVPSSNAAFNALVKKNIFKIETLETGRIKDIGKANGAELVLSDEQQNAIESIKNFYEEKEVVLLHGVTGSGKTEIYMRLIEETLQAGKQALYLLPEIALTTQITSRLQKKFGNTVSVYHSKLNDNERVEVWNTLSKNSKLETRNSKLVLGARSALFLPFTNLGLVIVDEEHDTSFKQYDPAPRYNARDAAIVLARLHHAKTLLGSATPSIESYSNAEINKFGLVKLTGRYGGVLLPEIFVSDVKEAKKRKEMKANFSPLLLDEMTTALQNKEQVILFQNRRGYSPVLECNTCAWTQHCISCDVTLTYHKHSNSLRCHYCGYTEKVPVTCPACGDTALQAKGFGTEKVEEEISIYFPDAKVARMDLDTTRGKYAHQQLIENFEERNIDILVGTQMLTKGLDFDNVGLVGILNADGMLNFPDFRAHERSYQLMAQVSGRAGRKQKRGKVIIQTHAPEKFIIQQVISNNYEAMYAAEMNERKTFSYPPFFRLIEITLKHKSVDVLNTACGFVAGEGKKVFGKNLLGPEFPLVARIKGLYLKTFMLKIEREVAPSGIKEKLREIITQLKLKKEFSRVTVSVDVDPM